jgi:hypothetical protein
MGEHAIIGGAHTMHQPERGGVEDEPHLIGGRAVTRHAIRTCNEFVRDWNKGVGELGAEWAIFRGFLRFARL